MTAKDNLIFEKKQKEDFAIGFADWLRNECYDTGLKWYYQKDNEDYTSNELLEIYKKEKGL